MRIVFKIKRGITQTDKIVRVAVAVVNKRLLRRREMMVGLEDFVRLVEISHCC
jgi:hypothetical protein